MRTKIALPILFFLTTAFSPLAHSQVAGDASSVTAWSPIAPGTIRAEVALQREAIGIAKTGDIIGAVRILTAVGPQPERATAALFAWRAYSVAGSLHNQSLLRLSHAVVATVLKEPWVKAREVKNAEQDAEALYWMARLAEFIGEDEQAAAWLQQAAQANPESMKIDSFKRGLLRRLDAFPRT